MWWVRLHYGTDVAMTRRIMLLGNRSRESQRIKDIHADGWEIWTSNLAEGCPGWRTGDEKRIDRWYEIHEAWLTQELHTEHVDFLCDKYGGEVWVQFASSWPVFQNPAGTYPIDEIEALTPHGSYLASTFAYQVAHAILEEVDEIGFAWMSYHVMRSYGEPRDAQTNLEYWLGVAEGRGIKVDTSGLHLLRTWTEKRYGYDGMPPEWHENKMSRLRDKHIERDHLDGEDEDW